MILKPIVLIIFIPQLSIDLFNLYLSIKRERQGQGASPIPLVSLLISVFAIIHLIRNLIRNSTISLNLGLILGLILLTLAVLLHYLLVYLIPAIDYKLQQKNKK